MEKTLFREEAYPPYRLSAGEKRKWLAAGGALGAGLGLLYFHALPGAFLALPGSLLLLMTAARRKAARSRRLLRLMLRDYIVSVTGFLRSGYALENAMRSAGQEMKNMHGESSMIGSESAAMSQKLSLQQPPELIWQDLAARTDLKEGRELARIFGIAKKQGGDYLPVLESVIRMMDDREAVRAEIETLLTGQKLEYHVMCLVPAGILIYLEAAAPELTAGLHTRGGRIFMGFMLILHTASVLWGDHILEQAYEYR